jgi:hypothetical protein
MTYDTACGLECVPVDIACNGECPCPAFMCGTQACAPSEIVCTEFVPGVPDADPTYSCGTLPPRCDGVADPDCTCVAPAMCDCEETVEGRFVVTCFGN